MKYEHSILLFSLLLCDGIVYARVNLDRPSHRSNFSATYGVAFVSKPSDVVFDGRHINTRPSGNNAHFATVSSGDESINPRQLVIFRAPSRHTYGFLHNSVYDIPEIELRNLISCMMPNACEGLQFIPVDTPRPPANPLSDERKSLEPKPQSKQQSKKKKSKLGHDVNLLYWIECSNEVITSDTIARAASRAVLTHATFTIEQSLSLSPEDWDKALFDCHDDHNPLENVLEQMDIIDMTNPNLSSDDRSRLIDRLSSLMNKHNPDRSLLRLQNAPGADMKSPPILIHAAPSHNNQLSTHLLYFGHRTSIGPAGTQGAPSQTLRRTHRGILKQYALKNRHVGVSHITSTAMEPEIGFLMANLALSGTNPIHARVLDPCCGSGSLLLYSAALGATNLVGVDSDPNVWTDAELEFQRHTFLEGTRQLAVPNFCCGDVQNPESTEAFCIAESFDAIVCDPPYNIGAPVLVGGEDQRPETRDAHVVSADVDLVPHILSIARNVLVNRGRLVLFLPVRGEEMTRSIEDLLLSRGCSEWEVGAGGQDGELDGSLRLLGHSTRLQRFSPTFARWLVCLEKRKLR